MSDTNVGVSSWFHRIPLRPRSDTTKNVLMMSHIELKWVATSREINLNRSRSQTKTDLFVELDIHQESKQHSERPCTIVKKRSVLWLSKNTKQYFITSVNRSTIGSPSDSLSRRRKTSDYLKINDSQCSGEIVCCTDEEKHVAFWKKKTDSRKNISYEQSSMIWVGKGARPSWRSPEKIHSYL